MNRSVTGVWRVSRHWLWRSSTAWLPLGSHCTLEAVETRWCPDTSSSSTSDLLAQHSCPERREKRKLVICEHRINQWLFQRYGSLSSGSWQCMAAPLTMAAADSCLPLAHFHLLLLFNQLQKIIAQLNHFSPKLTNHLTFTNCFSKEAINPADFSILKMWVHFDH